MNLWDFHSGLYQNFRHWYPFNIILEQENKNLFQLFYALKTIPSVVLDIGTGHANALQQLKQYLDTERVMKGLHEQTLFIGVDHSLEMLRCAAKNSDLELLKCDAHHLSFKENLISLILVIGLVEYIPDLEGLFQEICRVLNKEGRIILTFSPHNIFFYLRFFLGKKLFRRSICTFEREIEAAGLIIEKKLTTFMQIQYLIKKQIVT